MTEGRRQKHQESAGDLYDEREPTRADKQQHTVRGSEASVTKERKPKAISHHRHKESLANHAPTEPEFEGTSYTIHSGVLLQSRPSRLRRTTKHFHTQRIAHDIIMNCKPM